MLPRPLDRLLSTSSFWTPQYVPASAWIEHAPFAFWLCDVVRPRRFVELGSHHGYSYFSFCQGFQQLGTQTTAYAVDTWQGDEHAGFYSDQVFKTVRRLNQSQYSGFSTLMRTTFEQAATYFEDGSIDLLHIDGRHFYEDVKEDYSCWLPKLTPDAIVLFHDTNVRERNFGVWKFFRELSQQHPAFNFSHCNGLGVLAPGPEVPPALQPLFSASAEEATQIRVVYASLGQAITARRALIAKTEALDAMLGYGAELSIEHAQTLGDLADGDYQIQEVLGGVLRAGAGRAELQQALQLHKAEAQQRDAALQEQAALLAQAIETEKRLRDALLDSQAAREADEARHLHDLRNRTAEFIAEQKRYRHEATELNQRLSSHASELAQIRTEAAELRQANEGILQELTSIYASSSWKMMVPLQRALTRTPLLRRTGRRVAKVVWWTATGQIGARVRARNALRFKVPAISVDTHAALAAPRDAMEASIEAVLGQPYIPESARAIDLDYSLSLPLRYTAQETSSPGGTVAAIIHMFYPELAVEFRSYVQNIPGRVNLYLSVASDAARRQVLHAFGDWEKGTVEVRIMPNRGRDIAPKLIGFRDVYDTHELVLHLHSKQSDHSSVLSRWRYHSLENLVGTPETVQSIFDLFTRNLQLGMVAAAHFEPVRHWVNWGHNLEEAVTLGKRMDITIDPNGVLDFPSGSMFWARSAALRPLLDLQLSFDDFPPESGQIDTTLAHAIERLYFFVCEKAGFDWIKIARPNLFSLTPAIINTRDLGDLNLYFRRHVFRLLNPGDTRPRTMPPAPLSTPSPGLLDQLRKHVLGQGRAIAAGSRVTLGIVTYNNDEPTLRLAVGAAIQSLRSAGLPLEGSVLLLDNGGDSSAAVPEGEMVRRLLSAGNVGFGAAHNRLMAEAFAAGADLYIAVNPDGVLHPDAVGSLLRVVQAHANRVLVEALQFPMEHPKPYDAATLDTPWLSGACLAIPRKAYEVLGGFDESFFMYCEDVDLSWRARAEGFALKTCPTALFLHSVTNRKMSPQTRQMVYTSGVILARKWGAPAFEDWLRPELQAVGAPLPEATPIGVPAEWTRYANFDHHFSFSQPRW